MTPQEHYEEAERLAGIVRTTVDMACKKNARLADTVLSTIALAQVHATLATVTAPTQNSGAEWTSTGWRLT